MFDPWKTCEVRLQGIREHALIDSFLSLLLRTLKRLQVEGVCKHAPVHMLSFFDARLLRFREPFHYIIVGVGRVG